VDSDFFNQNPIHYSNKYQNLYTCKITHCNHEVQEGQDRIQICLLLCSLCLNFYEMHDIINFYFYINKHFNHNNNLFSAIRCLHLYRLRTLQKTRSQNMTESKYEPLKPPKLSLQKLQCFLHKKFFNRHVRNSLFKRNFL
jgi:hypothetical protein